MKYFAFILAILLSFTSLNTFAAEYFAIQIQGEIKQLKPDRNCNILSFRSKHFPDTDFYGPGLPIDTCYVGTLTATINNIPITGTTYSGLTANGIGEMTAASAIRLNIHSMELGWVFTQDSIFGRDDDAEERLTMVSGTKLFNGGHGSIEIPGNAVLGPTPFNGVLCVGF